MARHSAAAAALCAGSVDGADRNSADDFNAGSRSANKSNGSSLRREVCFSGFSDFCAFSAKAKDFLLTGELL